ncbi:cadherin-like domain-containing protein [Argonema galeatum]|uniref:cadherin-like domain-containing protein n=1 Tax=Argonema galeatum TaxID=2942762 RepID=UPI0023E00466|nr:cadherin-like domain-containing protein [Argonema galeatum]
MAASITFAGQNIGSINEGDGRDFRVGATLESVWEVIVAAYPTADISNTTFVFTPLTLDPNSVANSSDFFNFGTQFFIRTNGTVGSVVITNNDSEIEINETFSFQPVLTNLEIETADRRTLALLNPTQITELFAPSGGLTLNLGKVTGTIIDNDSPPPINQAPTAVNFVSTTTSLDENTSTTTRIKVADIDITDDGLGTNVLSLMGSDASAFELDGTTLYLKAGTTLDYETKSSYTISVNVDDASVGNTPDASNTFTLSLNDLPENVAPVANPDTKSTNQNTPLIISSADLLANDTDTNGDLLNITGVSNATGGTVGFSNGNVLFTPNGDFTGAASFDYTITDGQETATTTVTVNVAPVAGINRSGGNGKDTLTGGLGRDTLSGGNGDDILNGGAGGDTLRGDNGNDTLIGGTGRDTVTGGNGNDIFVIAAGSGTDTFTDFKKGTDVVGLSGGLSFGQLSFSGNQILAGGETLANLTGIDTTTLTQSNFITI